MEVVWIRSVLVEMVTRDVCLEKRILLLENFVNLWVTLSLHETPVGSPWEGAY